MKNRARDGNPISSNPYNSSDVIPLTDLTTDSYSMVRGRPVFVCRCTVPRFTQESEAWRFLVEGGFRKWTSKDQEWISTRGSMFGNLTSFSARKLMGQIVLREFGERFALHVEVNTELQDFTQFNQLEIALELWTLLQLATNPESGISKEIEDVWQAFRGRARQSFFRWLITLMTNGRMLDEGWKERIAVLMPGWVPAPPLSCITGR